MHTLVRLRAVFSTQLMNAAFQCRSRHQLSYQQAQDIADGRPPPPSFTPGQVAELRAMLDLLVSVTDAWRHRRLEVAQARNLPVLATLKL